MSSYPTTPQHLHPCYEPRSPLSPIPTYNAKRKRATPYQTQSPWGPQLLTPPPFSSESAGESEEPPATRPRIGQDCEDIFDVFTRIEEECDTTRIHGVDVLDTHIPTSPIVIRITDFTDTSDDFQDGSPPVGAADKLDNVYEGQALESILTSDILEGPNGETAFYDGFDGSESANDQVCFGMIRVNPIHLAADLELTCASHSVSVLNSLSLSQDGTVVSNEGCSILEIGRVTGVGLQILSILEDEPQISVQLRCVISHSDKKLSKQQEHEASKGSDASLYAIIYGPFRAFGSVGDYLDGCEVFLQDPRGCDRNVPYRNPHRLSGSDQDVPMTIDKEFGTHKRLDATSDLLDGVALHSGLPLAKTPQAIRTRLHQYQQQALYFMLEREEGWSFDGHIEDVWVNTQINGFAMYLNTITDEAQMAAPPSFRGGLLADQMGLGKTLSIISLIASDLESPPPLLSSRRRPAMHQSSHYSKCTLVVVPPNLLTTWEDQLTEHCRPDLLCWSRHHERCRFTQISQLLPYNIVLTTYNTIMTEWRTQKGSSVLYSADWHRIVLDEGHYIRDERGQMARAICDLKAYRRWVITGTPIQNHLTDLEALLKFLRIHPYDEHVNFERDIVSMWKTDSEVAIARLKKLITCIGLRRPSTTVQLPPRTDLLHTLPFSPEEKQVYDPVEKRITDLVNQTDVHKSTHSGIHRCVLKDIELLRSICNLGLTVSMNHLQSIKTDEAAPHVLNDEILVHEIVTSTAAQYTKCNHRIAAATSISSRMSDPFIDDSDSVKHRQVVCDDCTHMTPPSSGMIPEDFEYIASSPMFPGAIPEGVAVSTDSTNMSLVDPEYVPTKIKALVKDLSLYPASKSVVFSAWRATLESAAKALTATSIKFTRFDGEMKHNHRWSALEDFRHDPSVRVMLITISCGAVGLDLTAADRAYIIEPQWNPTVEDQALARIHRMGQKRPVTTIRFVMADSIEQRVIEVQTRKKNFADLLLSPNKNFLHRSKSSGTFQHLRTLLS